MRQRRNNTRRSGFTLMEVLLVMAILVVMASLVTVAYLYIQKNANMDAAYNQSAMLANACKQYKLNTRNFPAKLDDLVAAPQGMNERQWKGPYLDAQEVPTDPWGNNYIMEADGKTNRVVVWSYGPDGQQGGNDDIRSDEKS